MSLILYLLQVTCCLAFFYGFYHLTLRKETLFETNRFYLVTTLVASIALPLIKIYVDSLPSDPAFVYVGTFVDAIVIENAVSTQSPFPWDRLIMGIYFLGIAVMTVRLLHALRDIQWIRQHGMKTMVEGHACILSEKVKSPFSFFNSIYFPQHHQFDESELKEIVAHELAHVKGRHTLDVLLMEAAGILLWPSPLIYIYRKALKDVHEFVADAAVIRDTPWEQYAQLLVGQQQGQLQNILSNQLIYSQLKKRLRMMNQEKSGFVARFKYLGIIPVVLIALVLFSFREKQTAGDNLTISDNIVQDADTVILYLTDDKRIFFGSQQITKDEIESMVKEATNNMPAPVVIVLLENSKDVLVGDLADILQIGTKMHMEWISYTDDGGKFDAFKSAIKEGGFAFTGDTLEQTYVIAYRTSNLLPVAASKLESDDRESPVFPGCMNIIADEQAQCGMTKLWEYINSNLAYPGNLKEAGLEGVVVVKFSVGADGLVKNISISKSLHADADEVVMRIVNEMNTRVGKWQPAIKEGKAVDTELCLPVKFTLDNTAINKEPLQYAEELPRFPGCEHIANVQERSACATQKMYEFIYTNIEYPKDDKDKNIEGQVIVQFVIGADGSISDIEVRRSPSDGLKAEVIRLINAMSAIPEKWTPARNEGKPVAMQFTLPVKFKLQDEQKSSAIEFNASVENVSNTTIKVIPNPAQESITVTIFKDTHTLKVFDTAGKLMITQKATSNSASNEIINISTLKPGQYVVQVISDKESLSAAFAVVK